MPQHFTPVVISLEHLFEGESDLINTLFALGLPLLHIRKPNATPEQVEALVRGIESQYLPRIAIHYHHTTAIRQGVGGIHLSGRTPDVPSGWGGRVSASCHSFDEVCAKRSQCDYVFLSPIYDSVSKVGYASAFTHAELSDARQKGELDERVIALGGVSADRISTLAEAGFGGAAVLGWLWGDAEPKGVADRAKRLMEACARW